jgi:succinyl-CoA synthetase beta subunit
MVKAQVLVGGRGKAGGVKYAATHSETEKVASEILGMYLKGVLVRRVLVVQAINATQEFYLGFTIDRSIKKVVGMASAAGGVDIEEVARSTPEKIVKVAADPFLGLSDFQARQLAFGIGLESSLAREFATIAKGVYQAFVDCDASLVEINPLAVADGQLLGLDTKIVLDDNALFRHPDLAELLDVDEEDPYERAARELGVSFVKLNGNIGCQVNGAGLAMATMDVIKLAGGEPANFLDAGGGAQARTIAAAINLVVSDPKVEAILFNIFGGITRCDQVAMGIVAACREMKRSVPMVARMLGTNEAEGRAILAEQNIETAEDMKEAAEKVVALAKAHRRRAQLCRPPRATET